VRAEQASGRFLADVETNGSAALSIQEDAGLLQDHGGLPNLARVPATLRSDGLWIPLSVGASGILINTDMVAAADVPKSWYDLLNPKWRGKLLSDDPRAAGGGYTLLNVLYENIDEGLPAKILAQKPIIARDTPAVSGRRIARGEFPIFITMTLNDVGALRGLPVKFVVPQEGAPFVITSGALLKNAPNRNAGRLLLNFLLSDDAMREYVKAGVLPAIDIAGERSPEMEEFRHIKLLNRSKDWRLQTKHMNMFAAMMEAEDKKGK